MKSCKENDAIVCPVCASQETQEVFNNPAIKGNRTIQLCSSCDLFFVAPSPTKMQLKQLYEEEWSWNYGMGDESSVTKKIFHFVYEMHQKFIARERAAHLFKTAPKNKARILEIGSGNGAFLEQISKRYDTVEGIEPSLKEDINKARLTIRQADIDSPLPANKNYNAICMYMVLEHLPDPVQALQRLKPSLIQGGFIIIEVPFSPYREFNIIGDFELKKVFHNVHLCHFSNKNVKCLADQLDMHLMEFNVIRKTEFIPGYNVFAVYPNSSREGLVYKALALFNLMILYIKGILRLSIHQTIHEETMPFGDGYWIRFVLQKK